MNLPKPMRGGTLTTGAPAKIDACPPRLSLFFAHGLIKLVAKICLRPTFRGNGKFSCLLSCNWNGHYGIDLHFAFPAMRWAGSNCTMLHSWKINGLVRRHLASSRTLQGFATRPRRVIVIAPEGPLLLKPARWSKAQGGAAFLASESGACRLRSWVRNKNVFGHMKKFRRAISKRGKCSSSLTQQASDRQEASCSAARMQALAENVPPEISRGLFQI